MEDNSNPIEDHQAPSMAILKTGRLFLRNLAFSCTESDLQELFGSYGAIGQVSFYLSILSKGMERSTSMMTNCHRDIRPEVTLRVC